MEPKYIILILAVIFFSFCVGLIIRRILFENKILDALYGLTRCWKEDEDTPPIRHMRYVISQHKNRELRKKISNIENNEENKKLAEEISSKRRERNTCASGNKNGKLDELLREKSREEAFLLEQLARKLDLNWKASDGLRCFLW